MKEEIEASSEEELGLVLLPTICPGCGNLLSETSNVKLVRLERKGDKFVASGMIQMAACRKCGQAVTHIGDVVPIELKGLTCECGGNKFRFTIKSLKPDRANKPTKWIFELDVICLKCHRRKFAEKIADFLS